MKAYLDLLTKVLHQGEKRSQERTGTGTIAIFAPEQLVFNLGSGFPLLTTKKVFWKGIVEELLWMIRGETNIQPLVLKGVHIWNDWPYARYQKNPESAGKTIVEFAQRIADDEGFAKCFGDLGPIYGAQWRDFNGFDQLAWLIDEIKSKPQSRRLLINAWNPPELDKMALPPCHYSFQFYVTNDGHLDCLMNQRSVDTFLGLPFNIASYALLTTIVAQTCGLKAGRLTIRLGDTHIYQNHQDQVKEQLKRKPRPLPTVQILRPIRGIHDMERLKFGDFLLIGYNPYPAIKAEISI